VKKLVVIGALQLGLFGWLTGQINEKRNLSESNHRIYHAAYSPDGSYIVTTGSDHNILIWNTESGIIHRTLVGLKKRPNQAVFSSDSRMLYSAGEDGLITCWDATLVQAVYATSGHSGAIKSLAINSSGTRLISGGDDKILRVWSVEEGSLGLLYELKEHKKTITTVYFSPDGRLAASGSADKTLILWDMQTGTKIRQAAAHDGWIRCVRFSPDGKHLCSAGDDRLIRIWNTGDLTEAKVLEGHTGWVQTVSYLPSGKHVISGGHDNTIRIWDTESGVQEAISEKLEHIVLSVDASPSRNDFISACLLSENLRIWGHNYSVGQEELAVDEPAPDRETSSETSTEEEAVQEPLQETLQEPLQEPVKEAVNEADKVTDATAAAAAAVAATETGGPHITIFSPMEQDGIISHDQSTVLIVGKAESEDGIQTMLVNRQRATLNDAGVFQADISLVTGENRIELVAVSNRGKMGRSEIVILCTDKSATATVADQPVEETGTYYALIIGIDEYNDEQITDLDFPIHDADSLYETLVGNYTFRREDITFLKNPTRTEMIIALDELGQKITEKDNLLIFYAGHGFWDEKSGIGYWLPSDAARSNTANWFRNSTLRDFIGSIRSRHTLLIADACFSGSIFKTRAGFASEPQGIQKLHELPSRKAMTSGTLKEVPDQSVFVKYLIRELKQNQARHLPSEVLFGNFKTAVLNNSPNVPQYGTIQNVGDEGGDFIFKRN